MFLSKISIHSYTIVHFILEENNFVVTVFTSFQYIRNIKTILMIALKLMVNKGL